MDLCFAADDPVKALNTEVTEVTADGTIAVVVRLITSSSSSVSSVFQAVLRSTNHAGINRRRTGVSLESRPCGSRGASPRQLWKSMKREPERSIRISTAHDDAVFFETSKFSTLTRQRETT